MSVTHVVGPLVGFSKLDRVIQRCAVCGEKLEDMRPSCVAVARPDGEHGTHIPEFPEAHLLRVTEGNPKSFIVLGKFTEGELPDDFCLELVEGP